MDRSEIFDKIAEVAADVLGVEVAEISEETTFDDLDANSLERLQLVTAIEDEFTSRSMTRPCSRSTLSPTPSTLSKLPRRPKSWLYPNDLRAPRKPGPRVQQ